MHTHTHTHTHTLAIHLHIDPDIIVIQAPPLQYALDGKSVTLRCTTDFPNSFITWLHGENINTAKQHSGVIGNVTLEDEGTYLCRVYLSDLRLTRVERVQLRVISKCKYRA